MKSFSISKISEYRTELMGVATILIFVVHSYDQGVVMPDYIRTLCAMGSLGVDIFLLVSGLGLWYSLTKLFEINKDGELRGVISWYSSRYRRILVPYVIISFPLAILGIYNGESIWLALLDFSTINFWLSHRGAWYVAMLIPIYAITPIHYLISKRVSNPLYYNIFIIVVLVILVSLPIASTDPKIDNLIGNIRYVLFRLPAFFLGFILAPLSKANVKISIIWMMIIPLFIVAVMRFLHFGYWPGFLVLPLIYILCYLFDFLGYSKLSLFRFYGKISLESYLLNVSIGSLFIEYLPVVYNSPFNYGCYLYYALVIIIGTLLAKIVNITSNRVLLILNNNTKKIPNNRCTFL